MKVGNSATRVIVSFMQQLLLPGETKAMIIWPVVLPFPSRREVWKRRPLRGDATDFQIGERAPSITWVLRVGGTGGDDVFQPLEGNDQQQEQEGEEAEEYGHIDVDVGQVARGRVYRGGQWRGKQLQKGSVLHTPCKGGGRVSPRHLYRQGRQVCVGALESLTLGSGSMTLALLFLEDSAAKRLGP